ncbi:MAG: ETX/MTX2 family pore-forming toxin [Gammaproteobacteria bacterium]|nr:ETX/MTX2 family pore-forming toxin [Gammaproteobacteria bacterium]
MKRKHFTQNRPCLDIQIDWSRLSVTHRTIWGDIIDVDFKELTPTDGKEDQPQPVVEKTCLKPTDVKSVAANVLFKTDFTNDTDEKQVYCLRVEKTTRSSCTTEIHRGVTMGAELNAKLNIGDVLEIGGAFSREVSLTKVDGETIEHQMTWSAESTIAVSPHRAATAEMHVLEKQQSGSFVILTTARGTVLIKYVSLKDNSLVFSQRGKICFIVGEYVHKMSRMKKKFIGVTEDKESETITFETKGECLFRFGIKQVVKVIQDKAWLGGN